LLYRFGPYETDASRNELRKFGRGVRLERKPWQLLISLLQRPGKLVTRAELQRAVWGADVFVDFEHGLNVAVRKLRAALNDSVDPPKYIETVAGEGYRFVGTVEQIFANASPPASAQIISQADATPVSVQDRREAATWRKRWREIALLTCIVVITVTG